jgi:hypothetical protein
MVELTLQISNSLAQKIQSFGAWSETVLELNLTEFKSGSVKSAKENLLKFLCKNPPTEDVLAYYVSEKHQERLDFLQDLNGENTIDEKQRQELSEWRKFNRIATMLKVKAAK